MNKQEGIKHMEERIAQLEKENSELKQMVHPFLTTGVLVKQLTDDGWFLRDIEWEIDKYNDRVRQAQNDTVRSLVNRLNQLVDECKRTINNELTDINGRKISTTIRVKKIAEKEMSKIQKQIQYLKGLYWIKH